jgi:geranylgeranyl pyrophosphate synthase
MDEDLIKNADACYSLNEQRAANYFRSLYEQVLQRSYITTLTKDIQYWKHNHIHNSLLSSFRNGKRKPSQKEYHNYIQWLNYTGKLENYLHRSISYIFMRDLGKSLESPHTQNKIRRAVESLKNHLIRSTRTNKKYNTERISLSELYRSAQKEGIEATLFWLINKIRTVSSNIPEGMDAENAQRKLIKIIAGVLMHVIEEMSENISPEERAQKLDEAIRLGYSYGLTYPFIDDLLDAQVLSPAEKKQYSSLIRTTLITGSVPELAQWVGTNLKLIQYIHSELREAFEYIKAHQHPDTIKSFLNQSYVFFNSQEIDRDKELSNANYSNEELYIPVILKSSSSRLIVRSVISAPQDEDFDNLTFYYGIYNQLADDFADMFDDIQEGSVTPYTYYLKYYDTRLDLINPFELYWTVISNLIHNVFHSDSKTCEIILDRAINGLKRYKERMGTDKYNEVMNLFASANPKFNSIIQRMVRKADDVDFFDKLLRDHIINLLKKERKEREEFSNTVETIKNEINTILNIPANEDIPLMDDLVIDAANYSLKGDGKRLRPIVTWVMSVDVYGLKKTAILPLVRALEYMHTASLIFDDLPSQDNSLTRRGRPTLHTVYNIAVAELTGLFLTQKAIEEQTFLAGFDAQSILSLIRYTAQITENMCKGQSMDLNSKSKQLTLEQLNNLCLYKTGIAFEASVIMPAILANAKELEIEALKKFTHNAGIAFQIKDDLLDVEGNPILLGKPIGKDTENHNSTFVTVLGLEGAKKEMWEHYCLAMDALQEVPRNTTFLKHLLNYIVNRDH